jgi:hypothetical protein
LSGREKNKEKILNEEENRTQKHRRRERENINKRREKSLQNRFGRSKMKKKEKS